MFHRCLPSHWDDLISLSMRPDRASCARPTSLQSNPRVSLSPSSITTSLIIHDVAPCFISAEQRQKSGQVTEGREMGMDPAAVLATQTLSGLTELRAGFFFSPSFIGMWWCTHTLHGSDTQQSQETSNSEWAPELQISVWKPPQVSNCKKVSFQRLVFRDPVPSIIQETGISGEAGDPNPKLPGNKESTPQKP